MAQQKRTLKTTGSPKPVQFRRKIFTYYGFQHCFAGDSVYLKPFKLETQFTTKR